MSHTHEHKITTINRAFKLGIAINLAFVAVEFCAGFFSNSLGLISDAGHNLSDVASLLLAMIAFKLAKVHANTKYTYGYKKSTILVSLVNAVILLVAVGIIISESVKKIMSPQPIEGSVIVWVAAVGVVVNAFTAWLFMKDKEKDLNVKGAYLHMAADALVSIGVVISGIVIIFTGWYIIDPIIGFAVAIVIIISTWDLLHDSFRLSMDGVPDDIDYNDVKKIIADNANVKDVHHLHIWAISTTENALTAHVVLFDMKNMEATKAALKAELSDAGISHATLEFENVNEKCNSLCD